jgi:hypothetical protein
MRKLVAFIAVFALAPVTAALAAGGATSAGYAGPAGVQGALQKSGAATGHGTLPFTGLSLLLVVVVGAALIAVGFVLRRGRRATS